LLISFSSATWLRVAQVTGLGFLFVPITLVAYVGVPAEKSNSVAGLVNFMRNMGSSVGTSIVTTVIARRSQFHQTTLVAHTSPGNQNFPSLISGLGQRIAHSGVSLHDPQTQAYARVYRAVQAQAATLAYIDTYFILTIGAAIMFFLAFLLKKNNPHAGGEVAVG
jgi:MFS transporter, DHA2 family, multidrug resistance protein